MTNFLTDRRAITQKILEITEQENKTVDECLKIWWKSLSSNGGLRLTDVGFLAFTSAKLEYWTFAVESIGINKSFSSIYLELSRKIPCPYYLHSVRQVMYIVVFDSRIASMIILHGSLKSFLKSVHGTYK